MAKPPSPRTVSVQSAISEFLDTLERKSRKSPHTISAYGRDLDRFLELLPTVGLNPDTALDDIEADHVDAVFEAFENQRDQRVQGTTPGRKHSPATVKRFRAAISSFFRNADELNLVQISPLVHSKFEPEKDTAAGLAPWRKALDEDKARQLLAVSLEGIPQSKPRGKDVPDLRLRDYLMIRLLMEAGPRVSELIAFELTDLTTRRTGGRTEHFLEIQHGKGNKARSAPLSPTTWEVYQDYIEMSRPMLRAALASGASKQTVRDSDAALFLSYRGRRMTPRAVELRLERLSLAAGARSTPHGLRHTAATQLLEGEDVSLGTVRYILGHADLATVSRYVDSDTTAAAEAVRRHPITGGDRKRPEK